MSVELRIAARPENVALARLALTGVAAVAQASAADVADLKLAVSEVCTNAVQHAYPAGGAIDEWIVVRYSVGDGALTVEVEDTGVGFDPANVQSASQRPTDAEGGMGLSILRAVTDELEIDSGTSGSRVVFSKRLPADGL
ncbi:MAG TPA: ATP-binding protein [Gaiellaceae bacterium]